MDAASMTITYPPSLPITQRRDDLLRAIRDHQVVIVAGETGSGKSTQLPKLCLELGRGDGRWIGHTQPRRVAARTIAERISEELGTELGSTVGYAVRFTDRVGDATRVKVMTDGILLAEIQRDRLLRRYDTLIIDEAHERSLNVDFLLGYLVQLLPQRPDLKLIITSATIDTERFAAHFGGAPVVEVEGRAYPVEIRHRPFGGLIDDAIDDRDQVQAICDAIDELGAEGPGDVLVFLSGEREIHDTADAWRRLERPNTEVLPLYARLSAVEQHRIFQPHTGRRIVLSTNVAETSLTVPGVRYVVDAGSARISRYSHRLKVQRLPIEPVSQASANQRSGRCGRVAPGICIRLYSDDDFQRRPLFTEPEILRTSLASVILQMTAIGLGDVAAFPFLDPPDARAIRDGVLLLEELGALEPDCPADARRLTPVGRRLSRLPLDPRLGRMVLEADRLGCVREVMIIAAAMSIQDPRERPTDAHQAADELHRRFRVDGSDFLAFVRLWDHLREVQRSTSSSQFRRTCKAEYLHYLRVREWQDLYSQLRQATSRLGIHVGAESGHPDRVHQALLAGLLSHLGMRDGASREFRGARGSKFALIRSSALAKQPPKWVMAGELVETNRLWGRVAAAVQPEWAERAGGHLVKRSYGDPRWDERRGSAVTTERVMLYGLPLVAGRQVGYDRVDRVVARELLIRHALVAGEWTTHHAFVEHNRRFVDDLRAMADRTRRSDLLDDESIVAFYDRRIGDDVVSTRHFDRWWKDVGHRAPELLTMTADAFDELTAGAASPHDFPDTWRQGELVLPVSYRFEPGEAGDGVTVHVPLTMLNQIRADGFDWQVPGFREPLVAALVRSLPKVMRRLLSPLADSARQASRALEPTSAPIAMALADVLTPLAGERVDPAGFDVRAVPDHLRITFSVDDDGRVVETGKDLGELRRRMSGRLRAAIADVTPDIEQGGITSWSFDDLAPIVETMRHGVGVRGYPALVDEGTSVSIKVFTNPEIQSRVMRSGVRRLLLLAVPVGASGLDRSISNAVRLSLARLGRPTVAELRDDCVRAGADAVVAEHGGPPWESAGFAELVRRGRRDLARHAATALDVAGAIVEVAASVRQRCERLIAPVLMPSVTDALAHLDRLTRAGFVTASGVDRLDDLLRYARGIERRIDKLADDPRRDQERIREVTRLEHDYRRLGEALPPSRVTAEVIDVGWLLEELRVATFAQVLGTARPVSTQRVRRALDALER